MWVPFVYVRNFMGLEELRPTPWTGNEQLAQSLGAWTGGSLTEGLLVKCRSMGLDI